MFRKIIIVCCSLLVSGCTVLGPVTFVDASPPSDKDNICRILNEKPQWREHLASAVDKYGAPRHVLMAIMHQESKFQHDARPLSSSGGGLFGTEYASTAYGFSQALNKTWDDYKVSVGEPMARRDSFKDSVHFIGWYVAATNRELALSKWDAEVQYLAYHEGRGGYKKKTYKMKPWLKKVAKKVKRKASSYSKQYKSCTDGDQDGLFTRMFL